MTPLPPRGLLAWIPFLWCQVLFPGRQTAATSCSGWSLAWLIILPGALLYPTRDFHLLEPDEGRYAQIAREMYHNQEWVLPTLQGKPYLDKPPLFYWLVRVSYQFLGVSDETARWIPALATHGTILLLYLLGRRSLGERSAFWGAMLLTVSPGFLGMSRLLILDGLLTFLVTACMLMAFEAVRGREKLHAGWWFGSAVACGLGVLCKGPISLILLVPPLAAHAWLSGQRMPISSRAIALYLGTILCINMPWYVGIYLREPVFLRYFFWEHNILRFLKPFDHLQPVWYYVPILLGGLMPATFLFWPFLRRLLSGDEDIAEQRTPELGFWMLAGAWCIAFFSLSGCKLPTYVLPAFPWICLVMGDYIARSRWEQSIWPRIGIGLSAVVLGFATYVGIPWYAEQRSPMGKPEVVSEFCADKDTPVYCFPRNCDSVAFYLGRDDLRNVRTKFSQDLIEQMMTQPKSVVLFTHRHSLETLKIVLPPQLRITRTVSLRRQDRTGHLLDKLAGDSPWGLCDIAVIERVP